MKEVTNLDYTGFYNRYLLTVEFIVLFLAVYSIEMKLPQTGISLMQWAGNTVLLVIYPLLYMQIISWRWLQQTGCKITTDKRMVMEHNAIFIQLLINHTINNEDRSPYPAE